MTILKALYAMPNCLPKGYELYMYFNTTFTTPQRTPFYLWYTEETTAHYLNVCISEVYLTIRISSFLGSLPLYPQELFIYFLEVIFYNGTLNLFA